MKYFRIKSSPGVIGLVKAFFSKIARYNALVFVFVGASLLYMDHNMEWESSVFSSLRAKIADRGVAIGGKIQSVFKCMVRGPDRCDAVIGGADTAEKVGMLLKENDNLKRLLSFLSDHGSLSYVTTRVIRAHDGSSGIVFIPLGRREGIKNGQPVVDGEGLIGIVADTSDHSARVLLITDKNFCIPVVVVESGVNAMLVGKGDRAELVGISSTANIKEGELVITVGDHAGFANGIYVGNVTQSLQVAVSTSRLRGLDIVSILQQR